MRFRGRLVDVACIQHFTRVVSTISKLAKNYVLRITPDKLYFILNDSVTSGGISIWCEMIQANFFDEYNMDGVSAEFNEIYLDIIGENIMRALKSAQSAKSVKVKLTKKHTPCLTFDVQLPSLSVSSRNVVHDVPVNVIARRLWEDYQEPPMPEFDISIYMPPLRLLRNVIDRMKNLSSYVILSGNGNGEMNLSVETDMVSVTTHFRDLSNPTWNKDGELEESQYEISQDGQSQNFVSARIDIKKFSNFLIGQQMNPSKVICNIVHNKVIHFFLIQDDLSLQYFIPVISL
ncbi:checkpoint protein HUS1-like [Saccoglossus kowalevskii]|uniref:Checkpoint protein n=1 Tax=Saccoglossus kowalevskii TaxID=10224 RepID=A0ABM0MNH7_SACKO|nr:PREDICTED: checkpoint protein HUS1-like [Saccoglossus kowalevskii]